MVSEKDEVSTKKRRYSKRKRKDTGESIPVSKVRKGNVETLPALPKSLYKVYDTDATDSEEIAKTKKINKEPVPDEEKKPEEPVTSIQLQPDEIEVLISNNESILQETAVGDESVATITDVLENNSIQKAPQSTPSKLSETVQEENGSQNNIAKNEESLHINSANECTLNKSTPELSPQKVCGRRRESLNASFYHVDRAEMDEYVRRQMEELKMDSVENPEKQFVFGELPFFMQMELIKAYLKSSSFDNKNWPYPNISKNKKAEIRRRAKLFTIDKSGRLLYKKIIKNKIPGAENESKCRYLASFVIDYLSTTNLPTFVMDLKHQHFSKFKYPIYHKRINGIFVRNTDDFLS